MTEPFDEHPLGPLSDSTVGDIDPISRDRIESGLRVQYAARSQGAVRSRPRWLVVAPALVILLAVATVALLARDTTAVAALEITDARGVVVTLPDGSTVTDPADGFELTDGAVVMVRDDGSVRIDDITLDGATTVTVRDGQLVSDVVATTTTDRPADTDRDDEPADDPTDTRPTTTVAPTTTVDDRPDPPTDDPDRPVDVQPDDPVPDPPDTGGGDGQPPGDGDQHLDDGVDVAVALRVVARDGGVRITWDARGIGDQPWSVVLVRTTDGSGPATPADGTVVGHGATGETVEQRSDLPDEFTALTYRVIVLDEADGVVARSAPQRLHPPDS